MKELMRLLKIREKGLKFCRISTFHKNLLPNQQLTKLVRESYRIRKSSKRGSYPGYQDISNREKRKRIS